MGNELATAKNGMQVWAVSHSYLLCCKLIDQGCESVGTLACVGPHMRHTLAAAPSQLSRNCVLCSFCPLSPQHRRPSTAFLSDHHALKLIQEQFVSDVVCCHIGFSSNPAGFLLTILPAARMDWRAVPASSKFAAQPLWWRHECSQRGTMIRSRCQYDFYVADSWTRS